MTITKARVIGVYVSNQDRALDFYVNTLGFEKRRDEPMALTPAGSRWPRPAPKPSWCRSRRLDLKTA